MSSEEELEVKEIQLKIDQIYIELAKGAFVRSRARWLEEGETNSSYFFALEKRKGQRKSLSMLNINGSKCMDQKLISIFLISLSTCTNQNSTIPRAQQCEHLVANASKKIVQSEL